MSDQELPASQQENLLCLLACDERHCQLVRNAVEIADFTGRVNQDAARAIYAYLDQYRKPPGEHLPDLLHEQLDQKDQNQAAMYARLLSGLPELATRINATYVLNQLESWVRRQRLMRGVQRAYKEIEAGRIEDAETLLEDAMRQRLSVFSPGLTLVGALRTLKHPDSEAEYTVRLDIPDLDKRLLGPTRKELGVFIAPPGRGKSWYLGYVGRQALMHRWRVAHVTLEMGAERVLQRYLQSLFGLTRRQTDSVRASRFHRDELGRLVAIEEEQLAVKCFLDPVVQKEVGKKLKKLRFVKNLVVKEFPSGSLTIPHLKAYLDNLERIAGFVPDLLIVDYADLMRINPQYRREELGSTYVDLRGLAVERNIAVATASQSNREGASSKLVQNTHVAEDWSKIMTADVIMTYNQTDAEKKKNLARLFVSKSRNEESGFALLIAQSYTTGQFCLDSTWMSDTYWAMIDG